MANYGRCVDLAFGWEKRTFRGLAVIRLIVAKILQEG